jgi:hypothetical protein
LHRGRHFAAHARQHGFVVRGIEHVGDQVGDLLGLDLGEAARGHRRRADADAAGDEGLLRIVRDRVLVDGDVGAAQDRFGFLAGDVLGLQVDQEDVRLGAAGNDAQAALFSTLAITWALSITCSW